jgi:Flp pilus assembly pilin Flp
MWRLAFWLNSVVRSHLRLPLLRQLREHGQGLVEYGLVLVLIMVVCVAVVGMTGRTISSVWYEELINAVPW